MAKVDSLPRSRSFSASTRIDIDFAIFCRMSTHEKYLPPHNDLSDIAEVLTTQFNISTSNTTIRPIPKQSPRPLYITKNSVFFIDKDGSEAQKPISRDLHLSAAPGKLVMRIQMELLFRCKIRYFHSSSTEHTWNSCNLRSSKRILYSL